MKHHEKNKTQKSAAVHYKKRSNIKKVQSGKRCDMKKVQHEEIATRNECNTKKVLQEMSAT